MAITLADSELHEIRKDGDDTFTVFEGQNLKIETSPDGEEILDLVVPAGETWTVTVTIRVIVTEV